jgi:hypothetical protein
MKFFSDLPGYRCIIETMGILDNFESAWDKEFSFEHTSLSVKLFSETCCNGCSCQTSKDHIKEMSSDEEVWDI